MSKLEDDLRAQALIDATRPTRREERYIPPSHSSDTLRKIVIGGVAFVIAGVLLFGVEFLVLKLAEAITGSRLMPRGLGWIVVPIVGGIAAARIAPNLRIAHLSPVVDRWPFVRTALALVGSWVVLVAIYVMLVEPFGYRWTKDEYWLLGKWLILPALGLVVVSALIHWALARPK